ncbi:MAG: hypothetical protein AAF170_17295 [Bacteroidota bacterium]
MRRFALLALLPLVLALSGCFQVFSTLTVRPDGSAQLVERMTFEGMAAAGMMGMMRMQPDSTDEDDEMAGFEARASTLGEGVTFQSAERLVEPGQLVYVVTYDVADVSTLQYSFSDAANPDGLEELLSFDESDEMTETPDETALYHFGFEAASDGQPATLSITIPDSAAVPMLDEMDPDEMTEQMAQSENFAREYDSAMIMMGRARIQLSVAVDGELVSTDGGWADGNVVTLSEMTMSEFLPFAREQAEAGTLASVATLRETGAPIDVPGLRALPPGTVTVRFQ